MLLKAEQKPGGLTRSIHDAVTMTSSGFWQTWQTFQDLLRLKRDWYVSEKEKNRKRQRLAEYTATLVAQDQYADHMRLLKK